MSCLRVSGAWLAHFGGALPDGTRGLIVVTFAQVIEMLAGLPVAGTPRERCDYSWLWPEECAHCLGHEPDWEEPRRVVVYE